MMSTSLICLVTLLGLGYAYQVTERESHPPKLRLRPGDLLRSLDELTSDAQVIYSPLHEEPPKPRISAERRAYDDEIPYEEPASEFDYDRAYEDFVSKYFAQGEDDLNSDDTDERASDIDDAIPYETQAESEEVDKPKSKKKSSKSKKCERVEIDDQNCVVCEDPKTNEKSKSCSYSSDSKPKSFAFSRERSSKHAKDEEEDDDDGSEEAEKSFKREASPKSDQIQPRRTSIKAFVSPDASADSTPKCTRKREDGMICYYCGNPAEHSRECMADKKSPKKRRVNESSKKDSKTKKIFKRMVTYSYKNDAVPEIKENTYAAIRGYKF